jgi:hypothetical protein
MHPESATRQQTNAEIKSPRKIETVFERSKGETTVVQAQSRN